MADIKNGVVTITGSDALDKKIEKLKTTNPGFEKRLRNAIRTVLKTVRRNLSREVNSGLDMKSDPRKAYKAVKMAVYKRVLGGNVSILNKRGTGMRGPEPPVIHQLEHRTNRKGNHRGGNRIARSERTSDLLTYIGEDRGFILRFLNQGTKKRGIKRLVEISRGDGTFKSRMESNPTKYGNRGSISARHWFKNASLYEFQDIASEIQAIIDDIINDEFE